MLLGLISIARANDIDGKFKTTFLGAIPVLSLYLNLANTQTRAHDLNWFRKLLRVLIFSFYLLTGLLIFAIGFELQAHFQKQIALSNVDTNDTQLDSALPIIASADPSEIHDVDSVAMILISAADQTKIGRVNNHITLINVTARNRKLHYIYETVKYYSDLPEDFYLSTLEDACSDDLNQYILSLDASIYFEYRNKFNLPIDSISITKDTCRPYSTNS